MAEDEDQNAKAGESKEDRASRMNSAKAFYRAMYAGAEPDPEEFGIDLGGGKAAGGGGGDDSHTQAAVLHLQDQLKDSEAKATEYENLYKRIIADFDNYKKRMDRERDEMQQVGMQKALEAILPGLDDLDMAQSKLTETTEPKVMLQSIKMIVSRFNKCLEIVGIKQMQVIGEPFDPRLHEPIQEVHTAEFPEGAVVQQLRPGYILGEKVLRPTLVNVAAAPLDGPGYQPPAPGADAKADGGAGDEGKVKVTEEDVIAASQVHEPAESSTSELPSTDSGQKLTAEDGKASAEPDGKGDSVPEHKHKGSKKSTDTGDAHPAVGNHDSVEQYATQDIPLKDFKASLEAEAANKADELKTEKAIEEAVASSEEA